LVISGIGRFLPTNQPKGFLFGTQLTKGALLTGRLGGIFTKKLVFYQFGEA